MANPIEMNQPHEVSVSKLNAIPEYRQEFAKAFGPGPVTLDKVEKAIASFEQVVQRDKFHAQNEIWREIGATYIAAGQYSDARDALEKFLDRRTSDPQGLYLMGRAHAGLGDNQEAASSMQACIEAVKTAPAYKYRTEKRWLNEAQQFLKRKRQEAVSSRQ